MTTDQIAYWDKRGNESYEYMDETFYTVTPIPFYYARRKKLLTFFQSFLEKIYPSNVLDFGCGDGYYLKFMDDILTNSNIFGCDISKSMVSRARDREYANNNVCVDISYGLIPYVQKFNLIFTVAVFAHIIDDKELENIFGNICDHINDSGYLLIFEQTARKPRGGHTWKRRSEKQYIMLGKEHGLELVEKVRIQYPLFQLYDVYFRRYLVIFVAKIMGQSIEDISNGNKINILRYIDEKMLWISNRFPFDIISFSEGNTIFVFKK